MTQNSLDATTVSQNPLSTAKIGNYVNFIGDQLQPVILEDLSKLHLYNPIKITRVWLIILGFKEVNYSKYTPLVYYTKFQNRVRFGIFRDQSDGLFYTYKSSLITGEEIKYIHDLQNLYFKEVDKLLIFKK